LADIDQLLNDAIAAARAGNKAEARRLLEEVLAQNDRIERAWLALAGVVDTPRERRICLENVVEINPNNERARQALQQLDAANPGLAPTRAVTTSQAPSPTTSNASVSAASEREPARPAPRPDRRPEPKVTPPTKRAGVEATQGAKEAWRGQREQRGFRISIPFVTVAIISVLAILAGITLIFPQGSGTPVPTAPPTRTLTQAESFGTLFPGGTPTATAIGTIVTDFTPAVIAALPSWTPSFTPRPSNTPTVRPTLPPLTGYELVYIGERGTNPAAIFFASADGSSERKLGDGIDAAWSPDGSRLAYVRRSEATGKPVLVTIDAGGSNEFVVAETVGDSLVTPAWSPNGERLSYAANDRGNYDLFLINADGSNQVRLTDTAGDDLSPMFSPDGTRLLYASDVTGRKSLQIVSRVLETGQVTRLTESQGQNLDPMWSPDGRSIVFASTRDRTADIYIMRADGSDERLLTVGDGSAENRHPAWSSDGNYLVFSSTRNGGVFNLFIMTPDGKNIQQITNQAGPSFGGRFRPNGS
jgi:hypothetical protein